MQQKCLLTLQYILICTALFFTGASNAGKNATTQKLDIANGSQKVTNALPPKDRVIYSLTPSAHHRDMLVKIESSNELVGFTVWDTGSHYAEPIASRYNKPLIGSYLMEVESHRPNIVWLGIVQGRKHEIIVKNEGVEKATFTLKVIFQ